MQPTYHKLALGLVLAAASTATFAKPNKPAIQKNGITVWEVPIKNSKMLGFKAKAEIAANTKRVLNVIMDVQKSNEWVPRTKEVTEVTSEQANGMSKVFVILDMPFPLADRELPMSSKLTQDAKGNISLVSKLTNIASKPPNKKNIRMKAYHGTWYLEPKGNDKTLITITGHADPAGGLPSWVANMFVTQQPYDMLTNLRKQVKKSRYDKQLKDFPQIK